VSALADAQILTSYIDVAMPVERRHTELQSTYRFKCDCDLCERDLRIRSQDYDGSEIDQRAAVWHRNCKRKTKGKSSLPTGWQDKGESFVVTHQSLLTGIDVVKLRCDRCKETFDLRVVDLLIPYQRAEALLEADAKGRDGKSSFGASAQKIWADKQISLRTPSCSS
jgi:hypothetical protein